ncbi:MAG: DUF6356 family protein [Gammaproteobacteria bacterium]|nr:DUF6356 family protein [Gammaproteobacteria bacterium]
MSVLTKHLDDVGETYFQHLGHAMSFARAMFLGSLACFLHALFPFLFEKTGSGCISRLYDKMVINRRNLTPHKTKNRAAVDQVESGIA